MRVFAITGGVACGKSTVLKLFAEQGATIYSADEDARAARAEPEVQARILAALGTLEPKEMAAKIYADPEARKTLNGIVHPEVRKRIRARIEAARASAAPGLVLYEVPLLFEGGLETWFDGTIAVVAKPEVQRARLKERHPAATDAELDARLSAQMDPAEKARRADFAIRTDVSLEETRTEIARVFGQLSQA
jgi:dephospho-CoA kinase